MIRSDRDGEPARMSFQAPVSHAAGEDDSYEAALRAADALFATAPIAPRPLPVTPTRSSPSSPTAESVFSASYPHPVDDAPTSQQDDATAATGGRILRAIDEPAADPFAAYAAERAPQRRGRKPGSKNKPKPTPSVTYVDHGAEAATGAHIHFPVVPATDVAVTHVMSHEVARAAPRAKREPFAWVRTKLRPGEKWKRRLPKVAW